MRKAIILVFIASLWVTVSSAQRASADRENVSVSDVEVVGVGNSVRVSFTFYGGEKVTRNDHSLVVIPVLRGAGEEVVLTPLIVRGTKTSVAVQETKAITATGIESWSGRQTPYYMTPGNTVPYSESFPRQPWMNDCELVLEGINVSASEATEVSIGTVANNLLRPSAAPQASAERVVAARTSAPAPVVQAPAPVAQKPAQVAEVAEVSLEEPQILVQVPSQAADSIREPVEERVVLRDYSPWEGYYSETTTPMVAQGSTGDELAVKFSFVEPVVNFEAARAASTGGELFDYNMPLFFGTETTSAQSDTKKFIEMTREGAVYVRFDVGSSSISRATGENNRMLVDLISSIRALEQSSDTRIARVVVAGFSAPEGTFEENERLAMERASVVRNFLTANSAIAPDLISTYNGSVDWGILRSLVAESDMEDKYTVLDIIDNTPERDFSRNKGRLGRLMSLGDGKAYRYMRQNFFPLLRQTGAYVKVYYENVY
jgi:outer membrane protein OmpA-like peptidoglycan-associated protein